MSNERSFSLDPIITPITVDDILAYISRNRISLPLQPDVEDSSRELVTAVLEVKQGLHQVEEVLLRYPILTGAMGGENIFRRIAGAIDAHISEIVTSFVAHRIERP